MGERSSREHHQTAVATLRNRVSRHVWLKYELSYRKALPMDALQPVGEDQLRRRHQLPVLTPNTWRR